MNVVRNCKNKYKHLESCKSWRAAEAEV